MKSYKSIIKIDKINYTDYKINYKNTKFEKLFIENKTLIPDFNHSLLSFNIYNTKSSFVNSIRRCILDELLVKSLYFDISNISTNDKFILNDLIQDRIQLISIDQSIDKSKTFSIDVHNTTTNLMSVNTNMLQNSDKKDNRKYFNQNIKLCDLKPNRFITINNININSDYGINNNIYSIGRASYEVINMDMNKHQSLSTDSTDFTFYIYSNGNITTQNILFQSIDNLIQRLNHIYDLIDKYNNDNINDELIININNNITTFYIKNEYHTLGNLIVDYMFELDTSTKLLNYNNEHPLKNEITIKTDNSTPNKLILQAISNIKIDFGTCVEIIKKK